MVFSLVGFEAPWIARVKELQSTAAVNVEAERKVVKLTEEMRDLMREMRVKVSPVVSPKATRSIPTVLHRIKPNKRVLSRLS
jgi:hypothetical protein